MLPQQNINIYTLLLSFDGKIKIFCFTFVQTYRLLL